MIMRLITFQPKDMSVGNYESFIKELEKALGFKPIFCNRITTIEETMQTAILSQKSYPEVCYMFEVDDSEVIRVSYTYWLAYIKTGSYKYLDLAINEVDDEEYCEFIVRSIPKSAFYKVINPITGDIHEDYGVYQERRLERDLKRFLGYINTEEKNIVFSIKSLSPEYNLLISVSLVALGQIYISLDCNAFSLNKKEVSEQVKFLATTFCLDSSKERDFMQGLMRELKNRLKAIDKNALEVFFRSDSVKQMNRTDAIDIEYIIRKFIAE